MSTNATFVFLSFFLLIVFHGAYLILSPILGKNVKTWAVIDLLWIILAISSVGFGVMQRDIRDQIDQESYLRTKIEHEFQGMKINLVGILELNGDTTVSEYIKQLDELDELHKNIMALYRDIIFEKYAADFTKEKGEVISKNSAKCAVFDLDKTISEFRDGDRDGGALGAVSMYIVHLINFCGNIIAFEEDMRTYSVLKEDLNEGRHSFVYNTVIGSSFWIVIVIIAAMLRLMKSISDLKKFNISELAVVNVKECSGMVNILEIYDDYSRD